MCVLTYVDRDTTICIDTYIYKDNDRDKDKYEHIKRTHEPKIKTIECLGWPKRY